MLDTAFDPANYLDHVRDTRAKFFPTQPVVVARPANSHKAKPKVTGHERNGYGRVVPDAIPNDLPWYWEPISSMARTQKIRAIKLRCADRHSVPVEKIDAHTRVKAEVQARGDAIRMVAENFPKWGASAIARAFDRDHTTILYHLRAMDIGRPARKPIMDRVWQLWNEQQGICEIARIIDRPVAEVARALDRARAAHFRGEI